MQTKTKERPVIEEWPVTVVPKWRERVHIAAIDGCFTLQDQLEVRKWTSCAIGELNGFPHYEYPLTVGQYEAGTSFMNAVANNDPGAALKILDRIDRLYAKGLAS